MRRMLSGETKVVWCGKIEKGEVGWREVPQVRPSVLPRSTGSLTVRRRRRRIRDALSYGQIMLRLQGRIWGGKEACKEALSRVGLVLSQG